MEIKVLKRVLIKNDAIGDDNRAKFLKYKVFAVNFISSPGAGKTTLLENSIALFQNKFKLAVIEGDLYTSRDAERLKRFNLPIVQINTEGGCHLDAKMVNGAIADMDLDNIDLLLIENVGNLVCPAGFDLGENMRVLVYSITEGEDKPMKYSTMFKKADVILINKIELASLCNINVDSLEKEIREVNPTCEVFRISALKQETLKSWHIWMEKKIQENLE